MKNHNEYRSTETEIEITHEHFLKVSTQRKKVFFNTHHIEIYEHAEQNFSLSSPLYIHIHTCWTESPLRRDNNHPCVYIPAGAPYTVSFWLIKCTISRFECCLLLGSWSKMMQAKGGGQQQRRFSLATALYIMMLPSRGL